MSTNTNKDIDPTLLARRARALRFRALCTNENVSWYDDDDICTPNPNTDKLQRPGHTYTYLPSTGRVLAGARRVKRAKEAPVPEVVVDPKDLRFGDGASAENGLMVGVGGVDVNQAESSASMTSQTAKKH